MYQRRMILTLALAAPTMAIAPRLAWAGHSLPPEFRRQLEHDANAPIFGNPEGNATLIELFDYNCQFCRAMMPVVDAVLGADSGLRMVMREWPVLARVRFSRPARRWRHASRAATPTFIASC